MKPAGQGFGLKPGTEPDGRRSSLCDINAPRNGLSCSFITPEFIVADPPASFGAMKIASAASP
jgi:hypothetical protein